VHRSRLNQFRTYVGSRPSDSLLSLTVDDKRIRDPRQAADAYAEAWALNYFLIKQRPKEYVAYLRALSAKKPLLYDSPDERLADLKTAFGDLNLLDAEFLRYTEKIK
jgi:hypothetical protein